MVRISGKFGYSKKRGISDDEIGCSKNGGDEEESPFQILGTKFNLSIAVWDAWRLDLKIRGKSN